jgi:hypothetical protein
MAAYGIDAWDDLGWQRFDVHQRPRSPLNGAVILLDDGLGYGD